MSQPELPPADRPDAQAGGDDRPNAGEIVRRNQAKYDHEQRCFALNAERLRIFSECLATPIRPARDGWFAGWRRVADGTASDDLDAVVGGLEAAAKSFAAMDSVVTHCFARAREWLRRARPLNICFDCLVGLETLESFAGWDSEELACVPELLAAKRDFRDWAVAIERLGSLKPIYWQMWGFHNSLNPVADDCLELLALIMEAPTGDQLRAFLKAKRGANWLAGLAGVMAVAVGPLLPDDAFRPADLPADDRQCHCARYLANLTVHTFRHFGQGVRFAQQYFPLPPSPPMEPLPDWDDPVTDTWEVPETDTAEAAPAPQERPAQTAPPAWDAKTRTLTAGGKTKTARTNGKRIIPILDAFERAGWPAGSVPMAPDAAPGDRAKCISRFLDGFPIDIFPDGTGNGMLWAWKPGG